MAGILCHQYTQPYTLWGIDMGLFDILLDIASTEVRDTYDRWLTMGFTVDPVPVFVRYSNHNIPPVIPVFVRAPWSFIFQGHKFSIGGSKK